MSRSGLRSGGRLPPRTPAPRGGPKRVLLPKSEQNIRKRCRPAGVATRRGRCSPTTRLALRNLFLPLSLWPCIFYGGKPTAVGLLEPLESHP